MSSSITPHPGCALCDAPLGARICAKKSSQWCLAPEVSAIEASAR